MFVIDRIIFTKSKISTVPWLSREKYDGLDSLVSIIGGVDANMDCESEPFCVKSSQKDVVIAETQGKNDNILVTISKEREAGILFIRPKKQNTERYLRFYTKVQSEEPEQASAPQETNQNQTRYYIHAGARK